MDCESEFFIFNGILEEYHGPGGEVVVPAGVTGIGRSAFSFCNGLTGVTIPKGVEFIGACAFEDCENLSEINIPDSVARIGKWAFSGCAGLSRISIPDSVKELGDRAFLGCSGLMDSDGFVIVRDTVYDYFGNASELHIPNGIERIGGSAFYGCDSLEGVVIPEGTVSIGDNAFEKCRNLVHISIPEGVTGIGNGAFSGCSALAHIMLPESVTAIGADAFSGCSSLTDITVPDGVTYIGSGVFSGCRSLTGIEAGKNTFFDRYSLGGSLPDGLIPNVKSFFHALSDGALKQYVIKPDVWDKLDAETQERIFLYRQGKSAQSGYLKCIRPERIEPLGKAVLGRLKEKDPTRENCEAAAFFLTACHESASVDLLRDIYTALKPCTNGVKAVRKVESSPVWGRLRTECQNPGNGS